MMHATRRIAKQDMILRAFYTEYIPHASVKGEAFIDLVVEFVETLFKKLRNKTWMKSQLAWSHYTGPFVQEDTY